jgi:hypothetical protein
VPRIRSIKPPFWSDLVICGLPRDARSTLLGLLNYADDDGRGVEEMRLLKAFIWPLDDDIDLAAIGRFLDAMEAAELVARYEQDGVKFFAIIGWNDPAHPLGQSVNKATASDIPAPPPECLPERYRSDTVARTSRSRGKGKERKGREGKSPTGAKAPSGDEEGRAARAVVVGTEPWNALAAQMRPEDVPAFEGFTRGARNPDAFVRMLAGIPAGLYGQAFDLETVGRALTQMAGNGDPANGKLLAGYCRSILDGPPPPRPGRRTDAEPVDEWAEAARKIDAQEAARQAAARV